MVITVDDEVNTTIQYIGPWGGEILSGRNFYLNTLHVVEFAPASFIFKFNGTQVAVIGTLPNLLSNMKPPSSMYSLDGSPPVNFTVQMPNSSISSVARVDFYNVSSLSPGEHTVICNVTSASQEEPYYLDYINFVPLNDDSGVSAATFSPTSSTPIASLTRSSTPSPAPSLPPPFSGTSSSSTISTSSTTSQSSTISLTPTAGTPNSSMDSAAASTITGAQTILSLYAIFLTIFWLRPWLRVIA